MKLTKEERNQLWFQSCKSFLSKKSRANKKKGSRSVNPLFEESLCPVNKTWEEILKKEEKDTFYLYWCKSMIDAKTLVAAFKIKYYDILIDAVGGEFEYVIWCKENFYQD